MREEAGLSREQLANHLGVTPTFISNVETGDQNLTIGQWESIIDLYGCNPATDILRIVVNLRFMAEILAK